MEKKINSGFAGLMIILFAFLSLTSEGQGRKSFERNYLTDLPKVKTGTAMQKYRMTAVYINRDLNGNFTGKTKVTGDYTKGLQGDSVMWNNIFISASNNYSEPFPEGKRQEYMEKMKYVPSDKMLMPESFRNFPKSPENVFARNLVWDMYTFEIYAWKFYDSLKLNIPYTITAINGKFDMAEIGNYTHNRTILDWKGATTFNGEICAVIDFNSIDNHLEISMDMIKTRGQEQYWGTVLLSMKTKQIENAVMYSGTFQEVEVKGMKDKILIATSRELFLDKIQ